MGGGGGYHTRHFFSKFLKQLKCTIFELPYTYEVWTGCLEKIRSEIFDKICRETLREMKEM
jgi:hypothetical protein